MKISDVRFNTNEGFLEIQLNLLDDKDNPFATNIKLTIVQTKLLRDTLVNLFEN